MYTYTFWTHFWKFFVQKNPQHAVTVKKHCNEIAQTSMTILNTVAIGLTVL